MTKPILFNTDMVRAILDGRKTVTRRVVKPQHLRVLDSPYHKEHPDVPDKVLLARLCEPPYSTGDVLWVRETFRIDYLSNIIGTGRVHYKADGSFADIRFAPNRYDMMRRAQLKPGWRPNENMPREAARIFLRVTDVRVERLQEITAEGINNEGVDVEPPPICKKGEPSDAERAAFEKLTAEKKDEYISTLARHTFMGWCKYADDLFAAWKSLWDSTIKPADRERYGWAANPFCWVIAFERCEKPEEVRLDR